MEPSGVHKGKQEQCLRGFVAGRLATGARWAGFSLLWMVAIGCVQPDEPVTDPWETCFVYRACGSVASGESCGDCDDDNPCTEDRCLGSYLCGHRSLWDTCACPVDCSAIPGAVLRVTAVQNGAAGLTGLRGVRDVVPSLDGRYVYVASQAMEGSRVLIENDSLESSVGSQNGTGPVEGALATYEWLGERLLRKQLIAVPNLRAVGLSFDERRLYVGANQRLLALERDEESGLLAPADGLELSDESHALATGPLGLFLIDGQNLRWVEDTGAAFTERATVAAPGASLLRLSPDGHFVWVLSFQNSSLRVFEAVGDTLSLVASIENQPGLDRPDGLALSDDGTVLYTAGFCDQNIGVFSWDPALRTLNWVGAAYADVARRPAAESCPNALSYAGAGGGVGGGPHEHTTEEEAQEEPAGARDEPIQMRNPGALALNQEGTQLLVAAHFGNRVVRFDIEGATLTEIGDVNARPSYIDFAYSGYGASPPVGWPGILSGWTRMAVQGERTYLSSHLHSALTVLGENTVVQQIQQGSGGVRRLAGAYNLAISPDGRHVYVAARNHGEIGGFSVDAETGTLREISWDGVFDVADSGAMTNVAVEATGENVFAVDSQSGVLRKYARDSASGVLSTPTLTTLPACQGAPSFPVDVALSHDGKSIYVSDFQVEGSSCLVHLRRDDDGSVLGSEELFDASWLRGIEDVAITADDRFVYTAAHLAGAVVRYRRSLDTGSLSEPQVLEHEALDGVEVIVLAPNEGTLYASSPVASALTVLARDTEGQVSVRQVVEDPGHIGLSQIAGLAPSADGNFVYAVARESDSLVIFSVQSDGSLQHQESVQGDAALDWPSGLVRSPDGRHLFVASVLSSTVSVWRTGHPDCEALCP